MARPQLPPGTWGEFTTTDLPDGRVEVVVRFRRNDGTPGKTRTKADSQAAAKRELKSRLPALVNESGRKVIDIENPTLADVGEMWLEEERVTKRLRPASLHEAERLYRRIILPKLGAKPIEEVTPRVVTAFYHGQVVDHAPQAKNVKGVLNKIMSLAVRMELITRNPVREVISVKRETKAIFAPDVDELEQLREAIIAFNERPGRMGPKPSPLLLDTVEIILGTSARIGEALGLRWEDVKFDAEVPTVSINGAVKEGDGLPKRWEAITKTEAGKRTIPIDDVVVGILMRRFVERDSDCPYVFHTRTGAPNGPQDVHRALRRVREHAGLPADYVPHALRKSVATAIANELDMNQAAKTLGHKLSRVTEKHYADRQEMAPDTRHVLVHLHGKRQ